MPERQFMNHRSFIVGLSILITAYACGSYESDVLELMKTDKAFSNLSIEKGMVVAFLTYADPKVVKLQDQDFPIWGIDEMKDAFSNIDDSGFSLSWYPLKAEIAKSQDLGYTMGSWKLTRADGTVKYGNYVSIWKKQSDGSWKYVLDAGTETPGEFNPERSVD